MLHFPNLQKGDDNCTYPPRLFGQLKEIDPKATKEEDFILDGNKPVRVPMMFRGGMYAVGHDDQLSCTVLETPYQGNITATFILPDEGKMKQVEEALRTDTFARWKRLITQR